MLREMDGTINPSRHDRDRIHLHNVDRKKTEKIKEDIETMEDR